MTSSYFLQEHDIMQAFTSGRIKNPLSRHAGLPLQRHTYPLRLASGHQVSDQKVPNTAQFADSAKPAFILKHQPAPFTPCAAWHFILPERGEGDFYKILPERQSQYENASDGGRSCASHVELASGK